MDSSRIFVAVEVGPPASSVVRRFLTRCRSEISNVRWVQPEQLHITLKFVGDVDNRNLPEICGQLRDVCRLIDPFEACIEGLGTFPRNKPPRIVWAGLSAGGESLRELHVRLDEALAKVGIPKEGRAYAAHLTLGRVGRGAELDQLASLVKDASPNISARFDVDQILLLASLRERGKIVYEPIDTVDLA